MTLDSLADVMRSRRQDEVVERIAVRDDDVLFPVSIRAKCAILVYLTTRVNTGASPSMTVT